MSGYYWIASYPKSGNTWLRLMLRDLLFSGAEPNFRVGVDFAPLASGRGEVDDALNIDRCDLTAPEAEALRPLAYRATARRLSQTLYRKVHDAWVAAVGGTPLFPPEVTLGAFYVVRDPRDVAVSWSHFAGLTLDKAIAFLGEPEASLGPKGRLVDGALPQRLLSWSGHVSSWLDAPGRTPCLLRYEDMLADPFEALSRAATYAGIAHNAEAIEHAVHATRFDTLKAKESRQGFSGGQQGSCRILSQRSSRRLAQRAVRGARHPDRSRARRGHGTSGIPRPRLTGPAAPDRISGSWPGRCVSSGRSRAGRGRSPPGMACRCRRARDGPFALTFEPLGVVITPSNTQNAPRPAC